MTAELEGFKAQVAEADAQLTELKASFQVRDLCGMTKNIKPASLWYGSTAVPISL